MAVTPVAVTMRRLAARYTGGDSADLAGGLGGAIHNTRCAHDGHGVGYVEVPPVGA